MQLLLLGVPAASGGSLEKRVWTEAMVRLWCVPLNMSLTVSITLTTDLQRGQRQELQWNISFSPNTRLQFRVPQGHFNSSFTEEMKTCGRRLSTSALMQAAAGVKRQSLMSRTFKQKRSENKKRNQFPMLLSSSIMTQLPHAPASFAYKRNTWDYLQPSCHCVSGASCGRRSSWGGGRCFSVHRRQKWPSADVLSVRSLLFVSHVYRMTVRGKISSADRNFIQQIISVNDMILAGSIISSLIDWLLIGAYDILV